MIIGGPAAPLSHSYPARPQAACDTFRPQDTAEIEQNLQMLRTLKDLQVTLGKSGGEADARLKKSEANLKLAQEAPRQFSPETHAQVQAYLQTGGPAPASLTQDDLSKLATFKKLSDQGVQFVESPLQVYQGDKDAMGFATNGLKTTAPECAFLKLIAYKFHAPNNQVHFCTLREGAIATSTLRAEYLDSLSFFLDQSQSGQTFYKPDKTAIEWASEFVHTYQDDPEAALVKARPGDLVETARALETDGYIPFRDAKPQPKSNPGVAEGSTQVVVGGVLLRKRATR